MPITQIPNVKQAESKLRLCNSILYAYEAEKYLLGVMHENGHLTAQELELCMKDINTDVERIKAEQQSTQFIQCQTSAA